MENIFGLTAAEMVAKLSPWHLPAYRAKQIAAWLYQKGATSFADMTDLPQGLRESLSASFTVPAAVCRERLDSSDGKTTKLLLGLTDGEAIETVIMRQPYGNSICVSTQVGCDMGCAFCASTLHGCLRSLTRGEIMAQLMAADKILKAEGGKIDTIVIMGMGEPLLNYANVIGFIRLCHEPYALNLGYRHVTISTAGIVPRIKELAAEGLPLTLSISLHAPNDDLRSSLMPINRKYPLAEVVAAGRDYAEATKRRVTYEYVLLAGINDSDAHAVELAALLKGQLASVNIIPINPVAERGFFSPSPERTRRFAERLAAGHITATVRRAMGADIDAACGQLRNRARRQDMGAAGDS